MESKRPDLVKYKKDSTRIISFRGDKGFTGSGTEAREVLKSFFKELVKLYVDGDEKKFKELQRNYATEIDDVNKILAMDVMK